MYQYNVWTELVEYRLHPLENSTGNVGKVLTWLHDIQIIVGHQLEKIKDLVKHLPMLASHTDPGFE
ncbi:hypothetical protein D3C78_1656560 [compost metagenome]